VRGITTANASTRTSTKNRLARWPAPAGWQLHYLATTGSTNDDARSLALAGAPERTIVLADEQSAGRGRLGRHWVAPPGSSLLLSIVLRRDLPSILLTALCSIAVVEAVEEVAGLASQIKWPNDVMIRGRKVAGILTEVVSREERAITIVGIGLNVNLDLSTEGLPSTATSLSSEAATQVDRIAVFDALLRRIDAYLHLDDEALGLQIRQRWEQLLWRRSQAVRVEQDGPTLYGVVEGLSATGALLLRAPDGELREVAVGDVGAV
jgi:BirA family transcriptional regulator, biotin operon repressor / biotin---[acetyl-CoA-carboxylase] ligase